jgi:hypothetical protein
MIQVTRATAHKSYHRSLCLAKRIQFVRIYLFAKIWFLAQILPPTDSHIRQINGIASWFIWQGSIFWVPLTTLQRSKAEGGWGLDDVQVKCKVLLYSGLEKAKHRTDSTTALLLNTWNIDATFANPQPNLAKTFAWSHLSRYILDMAYIPAKGISEMMKEYKRRMSAILHTMEENKLPRPPLRIVRKYTTRPKPWTTVWRNLHTAGLPDTQLSTWYRIIHDIVPTHEGLAAINIVSMVQCVTCGETGTLLHRLVQCSEGAVIWNWTRSRIAIILRIHQSVIPADWTLRPLYHFCPPQKHAAVTWILAQFICYRMHTQRRQSLLDYIDFMRRARWTCYERHTHKCKVGKYLDML